MFTQLKLAINQYEEESETENIFSWQATNFHTVQSLVSCRHKNDCGCNSVIA